MNYPVHEEFEIQQQAKASTGELRQTFPGVAESVDVMRDLFGPDLKVVAYSENGKSHKVKSYKADEDYGGCLTAGEFIQAGRLSRENAQQIADREVTRGRK